MPPFQGCSSPVIGLSATGQNDMEPFEKAHFKKLGYKTIKSGLETEYRPDEQPTLGSIDEFFSDRYDGTVRLIYADEKRVQTLKDRALGKGYEEEHIHVNLEEIARLR